MTELPQLGINNPLRFHHLYNPWAGCATRRPLKLENLPTVSGSRAQNPPTTLALKKQNDTHAQNDNKAASHPGKTPSLRSPRRRFFASGIFRALAGWLEVGRQLHLAELQQTGPQQLLLPQLPPQLPRN